VGGDVTAEKIQGMAGDDADSRNSTVDFNQANQNSTQANLVRVRVQRSRSFNLAVSPRLDLYHW